MLVAFALLALALLTGWHATPAHADTAPPPGEPATVTADALPTWQIDGVAWDQVVVGNTVYVTGSFAYARPPGTAASSSQRVVRNNLLAYDIRTGALITAFNHSLNAQGRTITASPDGTRLYVGGNFTTVDGVTHNRLVAIDITTAAGTVVSGFNANLSNTVLAVSANDTTVYLGGSFTSANGNTRNRLAAFTRAGGLTTWNPGADATVTALVLAPDQSRVVVGGTFTTLAGASRLGMGTAMTSDGTAGTWPADFIIKDYGTSAAVNSLVTDGTNVFGSAYQFTQGGNFEGRFALNPTTGAIVWMNTCHGDSYDVTAVGSIIYSASHQHDCSDLGWFNQDDPGATTSTHHFVEAETAAPSGGQLLHPIFTGGPGQPGPRYTDFAGQPSGKQLYWFPTLTVGTYTGQSQAAWSVAGNATYLSVGGEFPTVNGVAQQGLTRFAVRSAAPNQRGPLNVTAPVVTSQSPGTLRVAWRAASDLDNQNLTYALYRDGGATPIYTTTATSGFFLRPTLGYLDTGLAGGSSHTYRVRVTDPTGLLVTGPVSAAATVTSAAVPSYTATVRSDGAINFWRFAEASGTTAYDSAGSTDLTLRPAVTFGATGPIAGNGTAAHFPGTFTSTTITIPPPPGSPFPPRTRTTITSDNVAASAAEVLPVQSYTVEAWFRTTSITGGVVLSDSLYAPDNGRESVTLDRVLYTGNDGRVSFGVFNNAAKTTITSTLPYNDGLWHHVAGTLGAGGAALYVDGSQVAADAALVDTGAFFGHWRVGGDSLFGWTPQPSQGYFTGDIADAAVYPSVLGSDRIQAHFQAGGGVVNTPPVAAFTSNCTDLSCSFDASGSTDLGGSIASYAWTFGDGQTGTGVNPTHPYAAAGPYTVTLTVTDNGGATNSTSQVVNPTAGPVNNPPVAAFTSNCTDLSCSFDASGSSDSDGTVTTYAWDFGDGQNGTGVNPTHPYAAAGTYTVTLTVTDNGGATNSVSHSISPTAPANAPFVVDNFNRTVSNGWGTADTGGAWTVSPTGAFSVGGGQGRMVLSTGTTATAYLGSTTATSSDVTVSVAADKIPTASSFIDVIGRRVANQREYDGLVKLTSSGAVVANIRMLNGSNSATNLATDVNTGIAYTAGLKLNVRFQVSGTSPTTLRLKVWRSDVAEPTAWTVSASDSTAGNQAAGAVGLRSYLSTSATNAPLTVSFNSLAARPVA